jgi:hypothetical protein
VNLSLEARASGAGAVGTLGFGFWNDPFPSFAGEAGARRLLPASPQVLWFFSSSPPSDLPFSREGAGAGWRAASLRTPALPGMLVAALGAASFAALSLRPTRRILISLAWTLVNGAQSAPIEGIEEWRRYEIDWSEGRARFSVDGATVLDSSTPPTDALGLVLWIDNQWATFSTEKGLRFGIRPLAAGASLELRGLRLNGRSLNVAGP